MYKMKPTYKAIIKGLFAVLFVFLSYYLYTEGYGFGYYFICITSITILMEIIFGTIKLREIKNTANVICISTNRKWNSLLISINVFFLVYTMGMSTALTYAIGILLLVYNIVFFFNNRFNYFLFTSFGVKNIKNNRFVLKFEELTGIWVEADIIRVHTTKFENDWVIKRAKVGTSNWEYLQEKMEELKTRLGQ